MMPAPQYCAEHATECAYRAALTRSDAAVILGAAGIAVLVGILLGLAVTTARVGHYRGSCGFVLAAATVVTVAAVILT